MNDKVSRIYFRADTPPSVRVSPVFRPPWVIRLGVSGSNKLLYGRHIERALPATRKRYAHALANAQGTSIQNTQGSAVQNAVDSDDIAIA